MTRAHGPAELAGVAGLAEARAGLAGSLAEARAGLGGSLAEVRAVMAGLDRELPTVRACASAILSAYLGGGKLLVAGNGGSSADAHHFAAEFEGRFRDDRRGFPAICLTANSSVVTALANDYAYDTVFERQVETHGRPGDVFVAISTSGGSLDGDRAGSRNIALAALRARKLGLTTIGLTGGDGGALRELADLCCVVDSKVTARIQEAHCVLLHLIVEAFEERLLAEAPELWNG